MTDTYLEIRGLSKSFKDKPVLWDVSLSLGPGRVLGLLGKNGAGKTTLIKCALGLLKPGGGSASVFGQDAWDLDASAKARLGYVPQTVQLYPWMRVRQMIAYVSAFYPRWNDDLVKTLVPQWRIDEKATIGTLSVGELQKVGLVLALGHEPDLLILDEPAASLDPSARRAFLATLLDIATQGGRSVLLSTHLTSDLERVADHVAILKEGRVAYHGELDALKDSVKRLHLIAPQALRERPTAPGMLTCRVEGAEALLSVSGYTTDTARELRTRYDATVEVEDLNLEDIFLELHDEPAQRVS